MAINKTKNVNIQITFPKKDAEQLETLKKAFHNNGIKVSKSDILVRAFREYLKMLVWAGAHAQEQKDKVEEPQGEKKDA